MKALLFLAGAALLFATPAAAQELVTNGNFESGTLAGFTQFGNTGFTGVNTSSASAGTFGAFFGPVGSVGGITQSLVTVAGVSYSISFDLSNDGGTPNFFDVDFGTSQLFSATDSGAFGFTSFSTTAIATGASTTLSFAFRQDPNFFSLDNISVTAVTDAVPEPGTWAMMLIGFAGAGMALRRRRRPAMLRQAA